MKFNLLIISIFLSLFRVNSQTITWDLSEDGFGVSDDQEVQPLDLVFGLGLTSSTFSSSGAYAKGWSQETLDLNDYFQIAITSSSRDTLEVSAFEYSERRSNTGVRNYEIRYAQTSSFQDYQSLGIVSVPDNDSERDTVIYDSGIMIFPNDTVYIRWYGYNAESGSGSWRINNSSLKINLQTYVEDVTPPELVSVQVTSTKHLQLMFNEAIDTMHLGVNNFRLRDNTQPVSVDKTDFRQGKLLLEFANDFPLEECLTLYYNNIRDNASNVITSEHQVDFIYYIPDAFCILITEIMADPSPVVYLPKSEYIELYNTKSFPISIKDWVLQINSYSYNIGDIMIDAHSYALLVPMENASLFSDTLPVYEIFTKKKITNSEGYISIKDAKGGWIHQLNYTSNWHTESYKREGGWSLEMINTNTACNMYNNWVSSTSNNGGTPAMLNAVNSDKTETVDLGIEYAYWKDSSCVIKFNQMLSPYYQPNPAHFQIENVLANQVFYEQGNDYIEVFFTIDLHMNIVYYLSVQDTIMNCEGYYIPPSFEVKIGLSSSVQSEDVAINEIFFNPKSKHTQYIELYNKSDKIIDLQDLKIGVKKDGELDYNSSLFDFPLLIFPKEYVALTKNKADVEQFFYVKHPNKLYQSLNLPSFSSSKGNVVLANKGDLLIDEIFYDEEYHSALLYDVEGVALEKINPTLSGIEPQSWQSASESFGYGTPTYQNSQFSNLKNVSDSEFNLQTESFSPDMDGYQDYMVLNYQLEKSDYKANVQVYDSRGRKVKDLVDNQYLAKEGVWAWNGEDDNGKLQPIGIYIVFIELVHSDGDVLQKKLACTLSAKKR